LRKRSGKTVAEKSSFYLNYSEDSDYVPTDEYSGSDYEDNGASPSSSAVKKSGTKKRQRKTVKKSLVEKSSDDEDSCEYESDYERPSKRCK
jgi:hypothetical protein